MKRFLLAALLAAISLPASATQAIRMVPGQSLGNVQLGISDTEAVQKLTALMKAKPTVSGKDTEYEGQVVYYYFFGKKDANNSYPLQVYADVHHKVFIFEVNSADFMTPEGIHVGSSETELTQAYGNALKKLKRGSIYTKYSLGGKQGTDFYVKNGKVTQILIRAY